MSWFVSLGHWNWFIAVAALFLIEIIAPAAS
jgi:membrane protein implicated in regulation of membrane protease activity